MSKVKRERLERIETAQEAWRFISEAESARFSFERQWYVNGAFYDNHHYVYFDRATGTLQKIEPVAGQVYRSVPKATRQIDSMVNMCSSTDLRWVVKPPAAMGIDQEKADDYASKVSHYLQDIFRKAKVADKLSELMLAGFKYPVAYFWPGYDSSTGEYYVDVYDVFDIYFDKPDIKDVQEAGMIAKCFTKSILELQANPHYKNTDDLTPDGRLAVSDTKNAQEQEKFSQIGSKTPNTIKCAEVWRKVFTMDGDKVRTQMEKFTVAGDTVISEIETVDQDWFPPVAFKTRPGPLYQTAWIELLLSLNKSIDSMAGMLETYGKGIAKPTLLTQAGQELEVVDMPNARIIKWSGGMPPDWLKPPPLPREMSGFIGLLEKWIEEAATSNINMGQIPTQIKAAKAIESLKQGDYVNLTSAIRGLKSTLSELAHRFIQLGDKYQEKPWPVMPKDGSMFFMGTQASMERHRILSQEPPPDHHILDPSVDIEVETDSGLGYTEEGKRETLKELYSLQPPVIDAKTLLKGYRLDDIDGILQQVRLDQGISMVDTEDFKLLSPEIQQAALQQLASMSPPDGSGGGDMNGQPQGPPQTPDQGQQGQGASPPVG